MKNSPHLLVDFGSYSLKLALAEIQNCNTNIKKLDEIPWNSERIRPIKGDINHLNDEELDQLIDFIRKKIKSFTTKYQRAIIACHPHFVNYKLETTQTELIDQKKINPREVSKIYKKKINENYNLVSLNLKNF